MILRTTKPKIYRRNGQSPSSNPLEGLTPLFAENFPYSDGLLETVSGGLWVNSANEIQVVSNRLDDTVTGQAIYNYPSKTILRNVSHGIKVTMPFTSWDIIDTNNQIFAVYSDVLGPNATGLVIQKINATQYAVGYVLPSSAPVTITVPADDLSHEVVITYRVSGGNFDVRVFIDNIKVLEVLSAFAASALVISPWLLATVISTVTPRGADSIDWYEN